MAIHLDGKCISLDGPVYLMAEVGTTANGNLEMAKSLIDVARDSGFDAVKFQNISPKDFMSDRTVKYRYMTASGPQERNMFAMLEPLTFTREAWGEIMAHARRREITCFASVDYHGGVECMEELGAPAYKISSWDLNYPDLQLQMFKTGKPVFIDLGPVGFLEVLKIRELARSVGNNQIIFLLDFHTSNLAEMHMRAVPFLEKNLEEVVGFSSPGKEWELDVLSLGLGAKVVEKRITLDDKDPGHHHAVSICGPEVPLWIKTMRRMETALGEKRLIASRADLNDAKKYFRGVTTLTKIRKGDAFTPANLGAKRPMNGLAPEYLPILWGNVAAADLEPDTQIDWQQVTFQVPSQKAKSVA